MGLENESVLTRKGRDKSNLPAAAVSNCTALLEGEQLLGSERFVVDLAGRLDQVLQVGAGKEVAEIDEFAVVLVLDVDGAPSALSAADSATVDVQRLVATNNGEGNEALHHVLEGDFGVKLLEWYLDLLVDSGLLVVVLFVLVGVEADVVESELVSDSVLEGLTLLESQGV